MGSQIAVAVANFLKNKKIKCKKHSLKVVNMSEFEDNCKREEWGLSLIRWYHSQEEASQ